MKKKTFQTSQHWWVQTHGRLQAFLFNLVPFNCFECLHKTQQKLKSFVKFISLFSYFEVEKMTRSKRIVGNILGGFSKDNATSMMKARTDSKT